jgi:hypothetical protein
MPTYCEPGPGEWVTPQRKGFLIRCCHCGLTHRFDFRIQRRGKHRLIQMRAFLAPRSTAAVRRRPQKCMPVKSA